MPTVMIVCERICTFIKQKSISLHKQSDNRNAKYLHYNDQCYNILLCSVILVCETQRKLHSKGWFDQQKNPGYIFGGATVAVVVFLYGKKLKKAVSSLGGSALSEKRIIRC